MKSEQFQALLPQIDRLTAEQRGRALADLNQGHEAVASLAAIELCAGQQRRCPAATRPAPWRAAGRMGCLAAHARPLPSLGCDQPPEPVQAFRTAVSRCSHKKSGQLRPLVLATWLLQPVSPGSVLPRPPPKHACVARTGPRTLMNCISLQVIWQTCGAGTGRFALASRRPVRMNCGGWRVERRACPRTCRLEAHMGNAVLTIRLNLRLIAQP